MLLNTRTLYNLAGSHLHELAATCAFSISWITVSAVQLIQLIEIYAVYPSTCPVTTESGTAVQGSQQA